MLDRLMHQGYGVPLGVPGGEGGEAPLGLWHEVRQDGLLAVFRRGRVDAVSIES